LRLLNFCPCNHQVVILLEHADLIMAGDALVTLKQPADSAFGDTHLF
jgi:hypothetical protein